ncbi:ATP-binding cassette domain-containing protein [Bacillaceae bacterium SIJ1]|uniref:ATP-binding cassette domain-containing protein n=1 Tax=Litoribacterium kuwaitense TaxID=1398745 RepID=UPI0013ED4FF1|nr:ATP-binding cassette domain-containing protein [Litoribacterium kuwaitense]NGP45870.1 ATP-binding cassette domain-containing protein [Litoribacterium kuwaitense]
MDITLKEIAVAYTDESAVPPALLRVTYTFRKGVWYSVIGKAGAGKSTLLQLLAGLLKMNEGDMVIGQAHLHKGTKEKAWRKAFRSSGYVLQFAEKQFFEETVEKEMMYGLLNQGVSLNDAQTEVQNVAQALGIQEQMLRRSPFTLSGGEQRKVAIASILVMQPTILLLDEPTAGLDPLASRHVMDVLKKYHQETQCTVVHVSHEIEEVYHTADIVLQLEQGTIVNSGDPGTILLEQTYTAPPVPLKLAQDIEALTSQPIRQPTKHVTAQDLFEALYQVYGSCR